MRWVTLGTGASLPYWSDERSAIKNIRKPRGMSCRASAAAATAPPDQTPPHLQPPRHPSLAVDPDRAEPLRQRDAVALRHAHLDTRTSSRPRPARTSQERRTKSLKGYRGRLRTEIRRIPLPDVALGEQDRLSTLHRNIRRSRQHLGKSCAVNETNPHRRRVLDRRSGE